MAVSGDSERKEGAPPTLGNLGWVFARYANFTLGGGSATTAVLHHELLQRRKWLTEDRFTLCFALGRLTPGTNLLAFCTGVGWLLRGIGGAAIALLASSTPCAIMVVVLTALFSRWQDNHFAQAAIHGAIAAAVAITVMNPFLLYLLLLKGTITAFAGLASLPVIQDALVFQHHVLTDKQLNEAVVITRSTPGPVGLYIVSVGYFVAGVPGAIAGWAAMITPALLIIPLVQFVGRRMEHPRIKSVLQTVVIASAGLLLAAAIPLARDALIDPVTMGLAVVSLALLFTTKIDTLWIILGAAIVSLSASSAGLFSLLQKS